MNKEGPIVVIEDDEDDQLLLSEVFTELKVGNEIIFFNNGQTALEYLNIPEIYPFLILSDINMPVLTGFELRKQVFENQQISSKCIPYLFFTTASGKKAVVDAYSLSVQGFFVKPATYEDIKEVIYFIIQYWKRCFSPNNYHNPSNNLSNRI